MQFSFGDQHSETISSFTLLHTTSVNAKFSPQPQSVKNLKNTISSSRSSSGISSSSSPSSPTSPYTARSLGCDGQQLILVPTLSENSLLQSSVFSFQLNAHNLNDGSPPSAKRNSPSELNSRLGTPNTPPTEKVAVSRPCVSQIVIFGSSECSEKARTWSTLLPLIEENDDDQCDDDDLDRHAIP